MRTLLLELRPQSWSKWTCTSCSDIVAAMECRKKLEVTVELEPVDLDRRTGGPLPHRPGGADQHHPPLGDGGVADAQAAPRRLRLDSSSCASSTTDAASTSTTCRRGTSGCRSWASGRRRSALSWCCAAPGHGTDLTVCLTRMTSHPGARRRRPRPAAGRQLVPVGVRRPRGRRRVGERRGRTRGGGRLRPDVVVIDLIMPGMGGVEAITAARAADESIGLLALSTFAR